MINGKVNFVVDGQWGSCGKGLIAGFLAKHHEVSMASTNNMPNAGHTIVIGADQGPEQKIEGSKFVSKILPVSGFMNTIGQNVVTYVGPGAGFSIDRLLSEIKECNLDKRQVRIHPRALVVTDEHAAMERGERAKGSTKHIASTMQGCGTATAERLMRGPEVKLAGDYPILGDMIVEDWFAEIHNALERGERWIHEGSQGYSLGLLHGSHYPYCTSRECTVSRELGDLGLAPQVVGDVYVVVRPYPIRVGNVVEEGKTVGYSGDVYPDQDELSWADVKVRSGYPADFDLHEMTTVTKRLRRVFTFSERQVVEACRVNGATKLALNFANYLDYRCFRTGGKLEHLSQLPDAVSSFVSKLERMTGLPVALVGTGPAIEHVWYRE